MAKIINLVNNGESLAVRSDKVIGFNYNKDGKYEVFLEGGGCVICNPSYWVYEQLMTAMKENK